MTSPSFRFHGAIYKWQRTGGSWQLSRWGRVVAEVVPDERYPSMFRVKLPDRPISDKVSLTRAHWQAQNRWTGMNDDEASPAGTGRGHGDDNTSGDVRPAHTADADRDQLQHLDLDDLGLDHRGLLDPPVRGRAP
jgi:hypothetical protein